MSRAPARLLAAVLGGLALIASAGARAEPPAAPRCPPEGCGRVLVEVRIAGDRVALPDAVVIVMPAPEGVEPGPYEPPPRTPEPRWAQSQRSDPEGMVRFEDLPAQRLRVAVLVPGYERREHVVQVVPEATVQVKIFVPSLAESPFRTVVSTEPVARSQVTERRLTKEEIATLPGSQGDPLRALQNLPGVVRPPLGLGLLVIRGAPPGQSRVFMGGHAMPRAFHFLSLASVFPADILDQMQYVPGNFDAAYGNATGGIVVIEPRRGRRDGVHGFGEVDLAATSAMVEGPLGRGSFVVGGQRAYVDVVLGTAAAVSERVTKQPTPTLLPRYFDYHALFDHPLRHGAWLGVRVFGSGDVMRNRVPAGASELSAFELRSDFHRVDLVYRVQRREWTVRLTPSFRFELGRLEAGGNAFSRRRHDYVFSTRAEAQHALGRRAEVTVGTDFELDAYSAVDRSAQLVDMGAGSELQTERADGLQSSLGVYASGLVHLGPVALRPGMRASAFTVGEQTAFTMEPRGIVDVEASDHWSLAFGLGRYAQVRSIASSSDYDLLGQGFQLGGAGGLLPSAFGNLDPAVTFGPENTPLQVREALHASATLRYRFSDQDVAEVTGFWVEQHNNVPAEVDGNINPFDSISRAVGLEALVRRRVTEKLYGWVGYTLSWAQLLFTFSPPGFPYQRRPSDYDQRHNLVAVLSYALPKRWRIGGRFRLVSGLPYTPVVGSIATPGGHVPSVGFRNDERLPVSHQLDLRIDKRWIRDRATVTAYMDVQNVYNRVNPEAVLYSADYRREVGYVGLPIFPSLGLRVDW